MLSARSGADSWSGDLLPLFDLRSRENRLRAIIWNMLIGIEASRANRLQKTGVEWYAYHLIQQLKSLPEAHKHSWLLYSNDSLSQGLEKGPTNWHERRLSWPPKYLWTQIRLSLEMGLRSPEVLFVPAHVLPRISPARSVVTVHDVGFHRFPQLYKPRQVAYHEWSTKDIFRRAARILTVSAFSKQEMVEFYKVDPDRIFVTHLGIDHERLVRLTEQEARKRIDAWNIPGPFFIAIGRLEHKKNITTLIEAFHLLKRHRGKGDETSLVLVGQPGAGFEEIQTRASKADIRSFVRMIGYASEEQKIALLSQAAALVHPSWYEGFGIPPLEAMACGCPVISSRASSLPEVIGIENALWFDPGDPETLAAHMDHVLRDHSTRADLAKRGSHFVRRYTWEETARQTLRHLTVW
ncbi:MAG TPA: glycosyltransferase family 1 protein [Patescibacteria group bacterium]|nr:glycosyltransferase family 1 protein [Patescibacteria group bacterium]